MKRVRTRVGYSFYQDYKVRNYLGVSYLYFKLKKKLTLINLKEAKIIKKSFLGNKISLHRKLKLKKAQKINTFKGLRARQNLPVRGQRTKNNAKTQKRTKNLNKKNV